jgi:DNA-binding NarL/FixJ family response regulator
LRDLLDVARKQPLDVVLIDVSSGPHRVLAIIWDVKSYLPDVRVVALGAGADSQTLLRCVEAGASGYTGPETSFEELLRTIHEVAAGRTTCSPAVLMQVMSRIRELSSQREQQIPPVNGGLSEREVEIVKLIALGLINKEISQRLAIKLSTVKNHVHNILQKLQVPRRKDTVQRAYELGILSN